MDNTDKAYRLPQETLPAIALAHHAEDIVEFQKFLASRGISTRNTRIERYIDYLQQAADKTPPDVQKIFKNAVKGPFVSSLDWLLYVMREAHEVMWILKGLKTHLPKGVDDKLKTLIGGTDFAAMDIHSRSRDAQFELRIASYFCQAGCEVDVSTDVDVIALTKDQAFYLECKRVGSSRQLGKRLSEARQQLNQKMPRKYKGRTAFGCVAADVTKAAFSHNGLTFGMTNEHSRDVVQKKLLEVATMSQKTSLFRDSRSLLAYWLQIHISALILYPPTTGTRFSSYHIVKERLVQRDRTAARIFYDMFESVSRQSAEREIPVSKLTPRTSIEVPTGTIFSLDEELVAALLAGTEMPDKQLDEVVGTLSMNGRDYEFSFFELKMVVERLFQKGESALPEDPTRAGIELILGMYLQRFPYEESDAGA